MSRELSFKNLSFVPVNGQVIYVEQSYNEKLNKFIRSNYEWLRTTFRSQGLEFCFLPLLAEETIAYNAPYLTTEERDNQIKNVPSLAHYLANGISDLVPSLIFALDISVVDEEGNTVLQSLPIETKCYTSTKSTFSDLIKEIKSVSKEQSKKYHEIERKRKAEEAARKRREEEARKRKEEEERRKREKEERAKKSYYFPKDDAHPSLVEEDSSEIRYSLKKRPEEDIRFSISEEPDLSDTDGVKFSLKEKPNVRFSIDEPETNGIRFSRKAPEEADSNFDFQSQLLIDEIKQRIDALRNRGVNTMFLHNLIDEGEHLSRLRITKDFRIYLVDYDNLEIKMPVLPKSVFLLFLRHPEGIRFKELTDYYSELLQIYLKMNPNGGRQKQEQSIRDITDPCNNSINEKCARIREAFVANFDDHLAKNYYVTGKRGEAKRILLDESMILWEK